MTTVEFMESGGELRQEHGLLNGSVCAGGKRELALLRWGHYFVILERADGSYIQTAGDARRLTLEVRNYHGFSFTHSVLGRSPVNEQIEEISHRGSKIKVRANEVLGLSDAIEAFRTFYRDGTISPHFIRRDATATFQ